MLVRPRHLIIIEVLLKILELESFELRVEAVLYMLRGGLEPRSESLGVELTGDSKLIA